MLNRFGAIGAWIGSAVFAFGIVMMAGCHWPSTPAAQTVTIPPPAAWTVAITPPPEWSTTAVNVGRSIAPAVAVSTPALPTRMVPCPTTIGSGRADG